MPRSNSPRAKHRRGILNFLTALKASANHLSARWTIEGTVYEADPRGPRFNSTARPRRADEYPEQDPQEWEKLAAAMDDLAKAASIMAEHARQMAAEVRAEGAA